MKRYLHRLIPATSATACTAALTHVIGLTIVSGIIGSEFIPLGLLTFAFSFLVALPAGAIVLTLVDMLKLGLKTSFILIFTAVQIAAVLLVTYFFEMQINDFPLQYLFISVPSAIAAWYYSVYHVLKYKQSIGS